MNNPSGTSNRTFEDARMFEGTLRQPHMSLVDATQALHLGGPNNPAAVLGARLSADACEFVPFTTPAGTSGGASATYYPQQHQQVYNPGNNYQQQQRFAGGGGGGQYHQQQPQAHHRHNNLQQYGGGLPYGHQHHGGGGHHHNQQPPQRVPSNSSGGGGGVQNRLLLSNNSNNNSGIFRINHHAQQQQQQQQLLHQQNFPSPTASRFQSENNHSNRRNNHNIGGGGMGAESGVGGAAGGQEQTQEELQALEMLRDTIQQLTDKPGMFEEYAMDLKEAFGDVIESRLVMSCAIEMLFEQSIQEPQCRYMGARLCHLLDTLAQTSVSTNLFRELLILKLLHHETELPLCMQQEQLKVRGTTLFLSDLYVQLNSDGEQRIIELARSILTTMELLLSKPGPENAKCVCQALKLCGSQLEQDVSQDIDTVMAMLARLENELDTSTSRLIESVLKLRMSRWGKNNMAGPKSSSSNYNSYAQADGPVFYGPDGQVLTDDEASFLNAHSISSAFMNGGPAAGMSGMGSNMAAGDAAGYVGSNLDPDVDLDMDPMVMEAYRQFLRQSQQNH